MECEYCKNTFSSTANLLQHQKTAKYCISLRNAQEAEINKIHKCNKCHKMFSLKHHLVRHLNICKGNYDDIEKKLSEKDKKIDELDIIITSLRTQNEQYEKQIKELQDKLENIALSGMSAVKENERMTKRYVKKASRVQYESNVIYMLTTDRLRKDRVYIIGKARNLTNRLSTYNKTDEHEVVYYEVCPDEDIMNIVESLVLKKMEKYREQANRDRFVLPEGEDIEIFKEIMRESLNFMYN